MLPVVGAPAVGRPRRAAQPAGRARPGLRRLLGRPARRRPSWARAAPRRPAGNADPRRRTRAGPPPCGPCGSGAGRGRLELADRGRHLGHQRLDGGEVAARGGVEEAAQHVADLRAGAPPGRRAARRGAGCRASSPRAWRSPCRRCRGSRARSGDLRLAGPRCRCWWRGRCRTPTARRRRPGRRRRRRRCRSSRPWSRGPSRWWRAPSWSRRSCRCRREASPAPSVPQTFRPSSSALASASSPMLRGLGRDLGEDRLGVVAALEPLDRRVEHAATGARAARAPRRRSPDSSDGGSSSFSLSSWLFWSGTISLRDARYSDGWVGLGEVRRLAVVVGADGVGLGAELLGRERVRAPSAAGDEGHRAERGDTGQRPATSEGHTGSP